MAQFFMTVPVLSAALLAAASPAPSAAPPDAQTLFAATGKALGIERLAAARGWHVHGTGKSAGLPGTFDSWIDRANAAEATYAQLPPISTDAGYDGRAAWTRDNKGVVWVDGSVAGRAAALNQLYRDTYAFWTPDHADARVEPLGRRTDGGTEYDLVRVTPRDSAVPFEYWFDGTTHLTSRVVETIPPVTTTTTLADYREIGGVRFASSQNSVGSDGNVQTFSVARVELNPAELAAHVRRPPSGVHDFGIGGGAETTLPFDLIDNHVYVDVRLNGKGPYRFIFDTGGANVIDSALARELGIAPVGTVQGSGVGAQTQQASFARVASLRVGAAELRDQTFVVLPVRAGFAMSASAPADGLIGWEVLARFVTTFDYEKRRLTLRTDDAGQPGTPIAFVFGGTQPQMPCSIDAIASVCAIDTGSRSAIDVFSPFIAAHPNVVPGNATAPGVDGFGVGGASVGRLGRLPRLQLGAYDIGDAIAGFSTATQGAFAAIGVGGNVGGAIWKRFTLTLNYAKQTLWLVPNAAFGQRETYDRSGIFAIARDAKLVVVDVRPGTPAAEAGIVKGDTVVAIEGTAETLSLASLRAAFRGAPGTVLQLRVLHAGTPAPREVKLTLRDYV